MRERLIQAGLIAAVLVAAGLIYLAFTTGQDETAPVQRQGIVRVFPEPNTVVLRQEAIGVEVGFGYDAVITIDRTRIPEDQIDVQAGINRFSFTPGPGKEIEQLDEGRHCATVEYGSATQESAPRRTYRWCFTSS